MIKKIVDPKLDAVDVHVAAGQMPCIVGVENPGIAGIIEIEVKILDFHRPIGAEHIFHAAANGPAIQRDIMTLAGSGGYGRPGYSPIDNNSRRLDGGIKPSKTSLCI